MQKRLRKPRLARFTKRLMLDVGSIKMKKIILKPKVLIVIGILFIAGALGGAVQTFRISQFDSWAVPEGFVIGLSIICVLQFALGTALLRLGLRESLRIQQKL